MKLQSKLRQSQQQPQPRAQAQAQPQPQLQPLFPHDPAGWCVLQLSALVSGALVTLASFRGSQANINAEAWGSLVLCLFLLRIGAWEQEQQFSRGDLLPSSSVLLVLLVCAGALIAMGKIRRWHISSSQDNSCRWHISMLTQGASSTSDVAAGPCDQTHGCFATCSGAQS